MKCPKCKVKMVKVDRRNEIAYMDNDISNGQRDNYLAVLPVKLEFNITKR